MTPEELQFLLSLGATPGEEDELTQREKRAQAFTNQAPRDASSTGGIIASGLEGLFRQGVGGMQQNQLRGERKALLQRRQQGQQAGMRAAMDPNANEQTAQALMATGDPMLAAQGKFVADAPERKLKRAQLGQVESSIAHSEAGTSKINAETGYASGIASADRQAQATRARIKLTNPNITNRELDTMMDDEAKMRAAEARGVAAEATKNRGDRGNSNRGFKDTMALRKEFAGLPEVKNTKDVSTALRKVSTAGATAAGDLSLIFAYMRMLDPGSTVREAEYANAENTRGIPDSVRMLYNKAKDGQKLAPAQRDSFKSEAQRLMGAQAAGYKAARTAYSRLAEEGGFNPEDIVVDIGLDDLLTPAASRALPPGFKKVP